MIALGLGTNQGDRLTQLRLALRKISSLEDVRVLHVSSIYESEAMLPEGAPQSWKKSFLNLAVIIETSLEPKALLSRLKEIEVSLGRVDSGRWAPREIDIDLLADSKNTTIETRDLQLPHPGLFARPFALLPVREIAPDWIVGDKSIGEHAQKWFGISSKLVPFSTKRTQLSLTEIVGILNVTPDSFSDGNKYFLIEDAIRQVSLLADQGATVLDIGAESTRPQATPLRPGEEWNRLEPVLQAIASLKLPVKISVDTRHAFVAGRALEYGVDWINDVEGFQAQEMIDVVGRSDVDIVVMHSLGVPPSKDKILDEARDPISQILEWAERTLNRLEKNGIKFSRVILDPGIGFGKSSDQAFHILSNAQQLLECRARWLIGHSRKSFLGSLTSKLAADRDLETALVSARLAQSGIHYLRVHNVESSRRALAAQCLMGAYSL